MRMSRRVRGGGSEGPEVVPRFHPVFPAADDFKRVNEFDAVFAFELVGAVHGGEVDGDGGGFGGNVGLGPVAVFEGGGDAVLDHLAGADGWNVSGGVAGKAFFDGDGGEIVAEEFAAFAAGGFVAGDEGDGDAEVAA